DEENFEIAEGFQIFITCNDLKKLSPALRSRCFCIQIETAQDEEQKDISINSEEIIKKIGNEKIAISSNMWEEFVKQAGKLEYVTLYQFVKDNKKKWPDDADELLSQMFSIHNKGKDRMKVLHQIDNIENFHMQDILNIFEKITIEWLKEMKFSDIRRTCSVLSEVDFVITSLYGISTPISQRYFRLHYLLEILQPAVELSDLNVGQGDIMIQKSIKKDGFAGYKIEGKTPEDWMLIIARIQHTIQIFTSLPEIFPSIPVYSYILSTYMKNFFAQQQIRTIGVKPTALVLIENQYIRKILQYINIISKEDESAAVVGHLARSDLDINMYINNASLLEKDNKTMQIILQSNKNPIIKFGEQELPAQIAEVSQTIPTSQLQITHYLDIDLSSLIKQTSDEIFNMKELTSEQKLWILTDLFSEIPSDFLTQNYVISELIQSIRQCRIKAIQIGRAPFGISLLAINTQLCEKAFEIA
ncbi:MAG: hypothetical protein EZS28_044839, partial [Streblomastix strix]